jgi:hypothetical protein
VLDAPAAVAGSATTSADAADVTLPKAISFTSAPRLGVPDLQTSSPALATSVSSSASAASRSSSAPVPLPTWPNPGSSWLSGAAAATGGNGSSGFFFLVLVPLLVAAWFGYRRMRPPTARLPRPALSLLLEHPG